MTQLGFSHETERVGSERKQTRKQTIFGAFWPVWWWPLHETKILLWICCASVELGGGSLITRDNNLWIQKWRFGHISSPWKKIYSFPKAFFLWVLKSWLLQTSALSLLSSGFPRVSEAPTGKARRGNGWCLVLRLYPCMPSPARCSGLLTVTTAGGCAGSQPARRDPRSWMPPPQTSHLSWVALANCNSPLISILTMTMFSYRFFLIWKNYNSLSNLRRLSTPPRTTQSAFAHW